MSEPRKTKKPTEHSGIHQRIQDALGKLSSDTMKSLDTLSQKLRVVRGEAEEVKQDADDTRPSHLAPAR